MSISDTNNNKEIYRKYKSNYSINRQFNLMNVYGLFNIFNVGINKLYC